MRYLRFLLVGLAALVGLFLVGDDASPGSVSALTPVEVAIDMDVTGNDARLSGGADIQGCGVMEITTTRQIDIILPPPGIAVHDGLQGYAFTLNYNPAVVSVFGHDNSQLLVQAPGSILFDLSDPVPSDDGNFKSTAADTGASGIEPAGAYEVGPGVLARISLEAVAWGRSALTLSDVLAVDAAGAQIPVSNVWNASVTVTAGGPAWPVPAGDTDCDGFTDSEEQFVGTDPADDCPDDSNDDAWPADFDMNTWVNILDIVQLAPPYFNTSPPDPNYTERKDFNGDGAINILDIVRLTPPMFHQDCAP